MLLTDIFALDALEEQLALGNVSRKLHSDAPLAILNYTPQAAYKRDWNDVTKHTRGLIYDVNTLEVIARPFAKFGNWDETGYPYPPAGPMVMSTKFDGSLGILYWRDDRDPYPHIATRGSFQSDQAKKATQMLAAQMEWIEQVDNDAWAFIAGDFSNPTRTYLFEVIYPENRIVVDYQGAERLVLLDVIDNETGKSDLERFDLSLWPDKAEKKLVPGGFSDTLGHKIPKGEEGFVLYFPHSGFRCKMKSAEYVELHRIVTGLSEKTIWEQMGRGMSTDKIKEPLPDELYDFVDVTAAKLLRGKIELQGKILDAWDEITGSDDSMPIMMTRKDFALKAKKYKDLAKYLFLVLDGSDERLQRAIWDSLKPVGDTRAFSRGEDVA